MYQSTNTLGVDLTPRYRAHIDTDSLEHSDQSNMVATLHAKQQQLE